MISFENPTPSVFNFIGHVRLMSYYSQASAVIPDCQSVIEPENDLDMGNGLEKSFQLNVVTSVVFRIH